MDVEARSDENLVVYYLDKLLHLKNFGTSLFTDLERKRLSTHHLIEKRYLRKNQKYLQLKYGLTSKCLEILKEVKE